MIKYNKNQWSTATTSFPCNPRFVHKFATSLLSLSVFEMQGRRILATVSWRLASFSNHIELDKTFFVDHKSQLYFGHQKLVKKLEMVKNWTNGTFLILSDRNQLVIPTVIFTGHTRGKSQWNRLMSQKSGFWVMQTTDNCTQTKYHKLSWNNFCPNYLSSGQNKKWVWLLIYSKLTFCLLLNFFSQSVIWTCLNSMENECIYGAKQRSDRNIMFFSCSDCHSKSFEACTQYVWSVRNKKNCLLSLICASYSDKAMSDRINV